MTVEVLISCMHQKDTSIIERTNIQTDVVVVNQCDIDKTEEFEFRNKKGEVCHAKFISTTERGLSRSRNMALLNASADICLICDDDEVLSDDYAETIESGYLDNHECGFISFNISIKERTFPDKKKKFGFLQSLKTASCQITFLREIIINKGIRFDVEMGAGVTMGGAEENRFLLDCLKAGLKGVYIPSVIGIVTTVGSTWDVTKETYAQYYLDRGNAYLRLMGKYLGALYIFYSSVKKYKQYCRYCSFTQSVKLQLKGLLRGK